MSDFEAASKWLTTSPSAGHLDNEIKLELYALYKFALTGSGPTGKRPGIFSFEARHKYDAWARIATAFGGRPDDAKARYVEVARGAGWMGNASPGAEAGEGGVEVEVKKKSGGMGFGPSVSVMEREEGEEGPGSALHDAASEGDVAALDKLLERNNVNIKDEYGFTPLHLAADRGRTEVVKLLLERGADKAILDPDEQTACDLAAVSGRDDIVALLR
ncbi:ankyrin [Cutaneotrichosporon oleaginosum]|uniref:Ankyrin n=1 Tax=Cutaneotrichosporon oleaginosum TaxID=879819 RepID=A0A0J1B1H9_9TREE|nr:ankyrin [Cutaneotrichosporon oleaginosum]KLT41459.1 ankyrin [Cutaneotrichosporon oleaginosum]TXT12219.1 hypothetical protein COLE_02629 [Cutaneotrichosporon oleaginosum]